MVKKSILCCARGARVCAWIVFFLLILFICYCRTNALQKAIFRAKNNGSSLRITLPFENILDIEQTEAFEFQKFLKIRAVGIDDSFVMDEVSIFYDLCGCTM